MSASSNPLRGLPAVDTLLNHPVLTAAQNEHHRTLVTDAARETLAAIRADVLAGGAAVPPLNTIAEKTVAQLRRMVSPTLHPVINATGVVIHTNLGRSLLSARAQKAMVEAAQAYNNLEFDVPAGKRGSRYHHAEALLCRLTGAEAAVVVNNNAAALVLSLSALAGGKEVLINRSQLIEIGGRFRIPDIMAQSGATLVEVGTTNRTYIDDFENNLHTVNTGLIMQVHRSNFALIGFTTEPTLAELVDLGERYGVPVMYDLGSGTLLDTAKFGLAHEPTVQESVATGAAIVTASGDKLLGGPQAGIILGRAGLIARIKKHPLTRAFRVDKMTLAALQATLLAYLEGTAVDEIPTWQMIALDRRTLNRRAQKWRRALVRAGIPAEVVDAQSAVGGGSLPGQTLPTRAVRIAVPDAAQMAARLRSADVPVITRLEDGAIWLDPRTVLPAQDSALVAMIIARYQ